MNRPVVLLGSLVLVAAAAALVCWSVPAERFIVGVAASGPDEALLLTSRNAADRTSFWLERVDLAGDLRWSAEVSPLQPEDALGFTGVAVTGDRVVALARRDGQQVALALDLADGRRLWETPLPGAGTGRVGPMVLVDGPRVYTIFEDDGRERITALALDDGASLWSFEPGRRVDVDPLGPGRLLVSSDFGDGAVLDGATGAVTQKIAAREVGCQIPGGVLLAGAGHATILPDAADAPPWRAEVESRWLLDRRPCGVRGEDPVLTANDFGDAFDGLVRIDRTTGALRWKLQLGDGIADPARAVDGRLPRVLPLVTHGRNAAREQVRELVVVDLDAGEVLRRTPTTEIVDVLLTPERAWLWIRFRGTLVAVDPDTGGLAQATTFDKVSTADIRRDDLRHGVLWLQGTADARPSALPWFAVDLGSGKLLRVNGRATIRDGAPATRAAFP